jgi:PadR family transcriptional regulator, regulatory protein PadR
MPRARSPSSQTKVLLDLMLSRRRQWLHGYELSEQTGLKSGTLYPLLIRLSDRGMLESKWEESAFAGRPPRRMYRLTAQGAAFAAEVCSSERPARRGAVSWSST